MREDLGNKIIKGIIGLVLSNMMRKELRNNGNLIEIGLRKLKKDELLIDERGLLEMF